MHRRVVNTVVVWLHILGPYWCLYVALSGSSLLPNSTTYGHQQGLNICSHTITTVLNTHRCILMDYFNNCNFSKHILVRSLMMV